MSINVGPYNPHTWTQRDGTEIAIAAMTDKHLEATINMILRKATGLHEGAIVATIRCLSFVNGDMASEAIESEVRLLESMTPREYIHYQYAPLFEELARRDDFANFRSPQVIEDFCNENG